MIFDTQSDAEILSELGAVQRDLRRGDVVLIRLLMTVEERRIHLRVACASLFEFCRRRLGMSEGATYRRTNAARLARRIPDLLAYIESGRVHLSHLLQLRKVITAENAEELIALVNGKSRKQVARLLATRDPQPDVPTTIRRLPQPQPQPTLAFSSLVASARTETTPAEPAPTAMATTTSASSNATAGMGIRTTVAETARVEPLSATRFKLQVTVSEQFHDKLERAQDLARRRAGGADVATLLEAALDLLLTRLASACPARGLPRPMGSV